MTWRWADRGVRWSRAEPSVKFERAAVPPGPSSRLRVSTSDATWLPAAPRVACPGPPPQVRTNDDDPDAVVVVAMALNSGLHHSAAAAHKQRELEVLSLGARTRGLASLRMRGTVVVVRQVVVDRYSSSISAPPSK